MKTLRAKISCYASHGVWKIVNPLLSSLAPKEVSDPFDAKQTEMMKFHVTTLHEIEPSNLDSYYLAPHIILYFFDSKSQQEFKKNELPTLETFRKKYTRGYINIQYVFVNDPKKTGTKSFFGDGSNYIPYLQLQLNDLSVFHIKSNGEIKKKDVSNAWNDYTTLIKQSVLQRVEDLKKLTQNVTKIQDFRNALTYVSIYDDLGYYSYSLQVLNHTKKQLLKNASEIFDCFMSRASYGYSLDLSTGSDEAEEQLASSPDSIPLYDLLFILSKRVVSCYFSLERPWSSIEAVWVFLTENLNTISSTGLLEQHQINLWVANVLAILIQFCQNEISMGRTQTFKYYTASLEWYLRILPVINADLDKYPPAEEAKLGRNVLEVLQEKDGLRHEMNKLYERLCLIYVNNGYIRSAALVAQAERQYTHASNKEKTFMHQMVRPLTKGPRFQNLQIPSPESYKTLKDKECMLAAAIHLVIGGEDSEVAAKVLNDFFSAAHPNVEAMKFNFPISVDVTQKVNPTRGQISKFNMKFICPFQHKIHVPLVSLIFRSETKNLSSIIAKDVEIFDGATAEFEGVFDYVGVQKLFSVEFHAQNLCLQIQMTNTKYHIVVDQEIPPFTLKIELPEYLLPNWQYALIKLQCSQKMNLQMKVNGIKYKSGMLKLENESTDIKPTINDKNEMVFEDVPEGNHELYVLIFAQNVGSFSITVSSENHSETVEQKFQVSEFLDVKVEYLRSTGVGMITGSTDIQRGIGIQSISFLDKNGATMESNAIGIPAPLGPSKRTALFEINGVPETAVVTLSQEGLKPFTLRFNVSEIDEEIVEMGSEIAVAPLTVLIPESSNLFTV
ncbi:hypothetical protein TVAG_163250 [Trichomonas vaginalis G3]|uniref:Uncharacterized protein n=1 Tax=Trichomonas vaginalis (strain ATCC PRA-98 / G3) TaxID=412133 RepID=A2DG02_TRIV3|nr:hypothetical protein TVAGG3_0953030 [Trichomonas vaginalis G3]EAY20629.1 hypothetical protein TVAG_163250 [Trichomonas vaginalis G3]KAI5487344.1 hypothetical protein TVAGG3_0953030 [Trichomonas vaginalis G3]|eukprot:XP_001581615.1 hypothetical protein [Trichomonas vaginalis G3]